MKNYPLNKHSGVNIAENSEHSESQGFESEDVALSLSTNDRTSKWFIDSAATKHMTYNRSILMDFIQYKHSLKTYLGENTVVLALGGRKVRLPTCDGPDNVFLVLHKVLFVPKLTKNLPSIPAMAQMGAEIGFDKGKCIGLKDNKQYNIGHVLDGKLYRVNTPEYAQLSTTSSAPSLGLWHCRLGHLNYYYVDCLVKKELVHGMKYSNDDFDKQCKGFASGKMHKFPVPKQSLNRATQPLELVHTEVCGPMNVDSIGGSKYMFTFTDAYTRYITVHFITSNAEVLSKFKEYVNMVENRTGLQVKRPSIFQEKENAALKLRSDDGREYNSHEFT